METPRDASVEGPDVLQLTILVPCFNEEKAIAGTLEQISDLIEKNQLSAEIIVVDDGSTDGTSAILEASADTVTVIKNAQNMGYGASLKKGIRIAEGKLICIIDADGSYPVERIVELYDRGQNRRCHMAVAARTGQNVAIPLIRKPAKWILGQLAAYVAGVKIPDMNSGMRIFPRYLAVQMLNLLPDGFSFTTTITLAMLTNGYTVEYVPIDYYQRVGYSKIRPIRDTLNFLRLILKIGLYFSPLKVFMPLSIGLLLLACAWALISHYLLGQLADVSTLLLAMTGIQTGAIGLLAEMIHGRVPNNHRPED